ncbi:MAG TPA: hypothetical protein VG496_15220, partial [Myxococcales bacterium]|nr:hypothetical protein [Myxococcales bacterium]
WHNTDAVNPHTATNLSGNPPNTGDTLPGYSSNPQQFPGPGTYSYQCLYHSNESGTVTIQ